MRPMTAALTRVGELAGELLANPVIEEFVLCERDRPRWDRVSGTASGYLTTHGGGDPLTVVSLNLTVTPAHAGKALKVANVNRANANRDQRDP